MSLLPPDATAALAQLLQALQSTDNVVRSQAEEQLNTEWVAGRPDMLLMGLVEQIQAQATNSTHSFAAVMFRRIATKQRKTSDAEVSQDIFISLQPAQRDAIRNKLLECLNSEQDSSTRHKIGDAVAEVARQYAEEDQQWPELLGALFNASQSQDAGQRESSFRIFAACPDIIEKQHEKMVLDVFERGFKDAELTVRLAAVEAFASFFRSLTKKAQQKYYSLISDILNILPPIRESKDDDQLTRALVSLIELAEVAPKMFKPLFDNLVTFSITVIQDKELEDTARQNALELMATFADNAPGLCKSNPSYTTEMVTQCLSLMTDVGADDEDASEWNSSEDLDIDESDMNHVAGEQCMDRLANKLGGQTLLPPTFNWLPQMIGSTGWRDRHAALMAISAISEGCRELMIGELDKVLDLVVPTLRDAHPRVRWAGCNALGQMSTDFAGVMQEKYHQVVLPAILPVLEAPEPRVQSHAAAALVNFCEEADKDILEPYLDQLLSRLLNLLQNPKRFVQEQALSTIATVADSAEAAFDRYYDTLMPLLLNVLRSEQDKEYRLLRAKAMECATLIALAVGKQRMGQDALDLVQILGNIQQSITDADDPQASYLLHCWGRMCRVLGMDFLPYLPAVVPPLVTLASAKADIQLLDDDEEVARIEGEEGWELLPMKGKFIGIRTSTLDDKHTAIELLVVYAQHLEAAFEPYVDGIMTDIALPGLAFFFHDPVRIASAKLIPQLLNARKKAQGLQSPQLQQLWVATVEKVLEALTAEPTVETLAEMYQCFYESVEVMGPGCLTEAHMAAFITATDSVLKEYQERVTERLQEAAERDKDEEEDEEFLLAIEDDQALLSDMNKSFHTVMKTHTSAFLPHWEKLSPYYSAFVSSQDPTQRQWTLCVLDDVLEFCGPQSWQYHQQIMQALAAGVADDVAANRQAACYGVGVAAQYGGEQWAEFAAASLQGLFQATRHSQAREEDHVYATDNACAAIAKILKLNASRVTNWQEVAQAWLETLPVVNDEEAAPFAYLFLAQLIEAQNPAVAPQAAKLFKDICLALEAETLQGQNAQRLIASAKTLVQSTGLDASSVLASLSPETQATVQAFFA